MKQNLDRAVLVLTGSRWVGDQGALSELFHLVDRPFVHHVVESIVARGCTRIDVLLCDAPEQVEASLGDGSRWGAQIVYHLAGDPERPFARIRGLDLDAEVARDDFVLLAHGSTLPDPSRLEGSSRLVDGWGVLPAALLRGIPGDLRSDQLEGWLRGRGIPSAPSDLHQLVGSTALSDEGTGVLLDVRTPEAFQRSTREVLHGSRPDLLSMGRELDGGGRAGWNARIHPDAKVIQPVYLGENSWIGEGAEVGPNAVVGEGSMIGDGALVRDAVVEPDTYVGEGVTLERVITRRDWMLNAGLGVSVALTDPLILSQVADEAPSDRAWRSVERVFGALMVLVFLPVLLVTAGVLGILRAGPVLFRPEVRRGGAASRASTPARTFRLFTFDPAYGQAGLRSPRPGLAKDLLLRVLPGMVNVARGELSVVGVEPRSSETVSGLPTEWREAYLQARPGLVTEADAAGAGPIGEEFLFASEVRFAPTVDRPARAGIVARYLGLSRRSPLALVGALPFVVLVLL
jgi:hypothetical protein